MPMWDTDAAFIAMSNLLTAILNAYDVDEATQLPIWMNSLKSYLTWVFWWVIEKHLIYVIQFNM